MQNIPMGGLIGMNGGTLGGDFLDKLNAVSLIANDKRQCPTFPLPSSDDNAARSGTKISRGGFIAVFFIQCLEAIGAREVRL